MVTTGGAFTTSGDTVVPTPPSLSSTLSSSLYAPYRRPVSTVAGPLPVATTLPSAGPPRLTTDHVYFVNMSVLSVSYDWEPSTLTLATSSGVCSWTLVGAAMTAKGACWKNRA
jgi:hypothetical protein